MSIRLRKKKPRVIKRTSPPKDYLPPSRYEMRMAAKRSDVGAYSPNFIEDLCNLESGGEYVSPEEREDEVNYWADRVLPDPDDDGDWSTDKGYTNNRTVAVRRAAFGIEQKQQGVIDFMHSIDMEGIPGGSPLNRAMNLVKIMSLKGTAGNESGGEGVEIPVFSESPEKDAKKINGLMEMIQNLSPEEKELLSGKVMQGEDEDLRALQIAEDMEQGDRDIWLDISRKLDSFSNMRAHHSVEVKADIEGQDVIVRPLDHLGEIQQLQKSEWANISILRYFRIFTRVAQVRERVTKQIRKQLLYLLIDCSGSMSGPRIAKAGGVLMNRLKAVMNDEAELYVRFFDQSTYHEHSISTHDEALEAIKVFREHHFSGGGTNIDGAIKVARESIEDLMKEDSLCRPELVLITDGGDYVETTLEDMGATRLHAFVVNGNNPDLFRLARRTGGVSKSL